MKKELYIMGRFFNMDNKFFVFMGRVADLAILNILCVICCIPIVTIGASVTALHYVTLKMVRNEESYIVRSFFKSFKENFKQATIINLIMLFVAIMLYMDITIAAGMQGTTRKVLIVVFMAFAFLFVLIFLYIYPVLAKFYNTIRNTFVNSFLMSIRHLPYTFLMLAVTLLPIGIFYIPILQLQSIGMMLMTVLGPALLAYINAHFLVKIFDNYIPKEDSEETDGALEDKQVEDKPV